MDVKTRKSAGDCWDTVLPNESPSKRMGCFLIWMRYWQIILKIAKMIRKAKLKAENSKT